MLISGAKCTTPPSDHDCEQKNEATRTLEKPPKGGDRLATRTVITNQRKERAHAGDKGIIQKVERSRVPKSLSDLSQYRSPPYVFRPLYLFGLAGII